MPQEPKKRHSRARQGKRRHAINLTVTRGMACSNCGKASLPHTVCKNCGYYDGRQVLAINKTTVRKISKEEASA